MYVGGEGIGRKKGVSLAFVFGIFWYFQKFDVSTLAFYFYSEKKAFFCFGVFFKMSPIERFFMLSILKNFGLSKLKSVFLAFSFGVCLFFSKAFSSMAFFWAFF